jgi:hypothetical protein
LSDAPQILRARDDKRQDLIIAQEEMKNAKYKMQN